MRYFFRVEYDGTDFGGWQRQDNTDTIQQRIEEAFATVLRVPCCIMGAGRTDAGVHARRQAAHFDVDTPLDERRIEKSVNAVLPPAIAISALRPVAPDFHARYSATQRRYKYYLSTCKAPLQFKRAWLMYYPVNWELVVSSANHLLGTHDFSTFCATGSSNENSICTVTHAAFENHGSQWIFSLSANRFVYKMVRSITGTLLAVGRGAITATFESILDSKNRLAAGETAPACGLVLDDVIYPGVD